MGKIILFLLLTFLIFSCKTSKTNCDAYGSNNKIDTTNILNK